MRRAARPRGVTLSFIGDVGLRERLQELASRDDRTVSYVLRDLVVEALARRERDGKPESPSAA